jgi:hypothetical protein
MNFTTGSNKHVDSDNTCSGKLHTRSSADSAYATQSSKTPQDIVNQLQGKLQQ